jgi:putative membrane protein
MSVSWQARAGVTGGLFEHPEEKKAERRKLSTEGGFMRGVFIRFVITGVAVFLAAHVIPGIELETLGAGIAAAIILALLNALVRPILYLFSLPLIVLTLGLFMIVINALLLQLVSALVKGFYVTGFWASFWGAVVISVASTILNLWVSEQGQLEIVTPRSRPPRIVN